MAGVTLGVGGGVPAATAAVTGPTLTVSPTHGTWSAAFTATYAEPVGLLGFCGSGSVTFLLDGLRLGAADLTRRSGDCAATLNVRLPIMRSNTNLTKDFNCLQRPPGACLIEGENH